MGKFPGAISAMKLLRISLLMLLCVGLLAATAPSENVIKGEILDYEKGYIVLTSGASYRVAPNVAIIDAKSGQPSSLKPTPGVFAQLLVEPDGTVSKLALSRVAVAETVQFFSPTTIAVPLTSTAGATHPLAEFARVTFSVLVPSKTLATDQVYMSTSETSWMPTAVRMDRIDARHFQATILVPVGTKFLYLYTRGSPQSIERANNGLQRAARELTLASTQSQTQHDVIDHWGDEAGITLLPPPQTFPTPYNPAPFPNLPPSPAPGR
jgi:hypothetical protein